MYVSQILLHHSSRDGVLELRLFSRANRHCAALEPLESFYTGLENHVGRSANSSQRNLEICGRTNAHFQQEKIAVLIKNMLKSCTIHLI